MMSPLMEQFLAEARELLLAISDQLMDLERTPDDAEQLTALFRMVHTLKGNSGLFEIREMTRVLHAAEDLMDAIRTGRVPFTPQTADALLQAMDFVALLCNELESDGALRPAHATTSASLADSLRAELGGESVNADASGSRQLSITSLAPSVALGSMPASVRSDALRRITSGIPLHWIEYTPDAECFFQGEDPLLQARLTPDVVWCDIVARTPWPPLPELDAYRCNLDFRMLSAAPFDALEEHFRYMPESVRMLELTADLLADPGASLRTPGCRVPDPSLRMLIAGQRTMLTMASASAGIAGRIKSAASALSGCVRSIGDSAADASLTIAEAAALAAGSGDVLVAWIDRTFGDPAAGSAPVAADTPAVPAVRVPDESASRTARRTDEASTAPRSLKVDQVKIDRLMNLIGEIIVAKNALPYLATRAEDVFGSRELSREIKAQHAVINRITEEMQDTIMQVRMMPVSYVLQRFPRLVRDTSRALGKDVHLVLEGEDTEADKNIIESIGDPLIHIVRNSLDHGFESPEERASTGKPATGTLTIRARQETDRVLIDIIDDGKGIDPAVVRRKAFEKGILDQPALDRLTDQAAVNLVFAAGFSTKDVVSDLSGRGVGMDVVRTAVEKVNGTVTLSSTLGTGTHVRLSLPLSMAVTNVMMVESDGQRFGVPMDSIVETVRVPRTDIRVIKTCMTTSLRGSVVPLRSMNSLLSIASPPRSNDHDEYAALVVRSGHESVGLLVDDFCGTVDVILKPMTGVLANMPAYAGSALMGDGSVLMVLDLKEML